jgi:hypothetical protein
VSQLRDDIQQRLLADGRRIGEVWLAVDRDRSGAPVWLPKSQLLLLLCSCDTVLIHSNSFFCHGCSGFVDRDEFRRFVQHFHFKTATDETIDKLFDEIDTVPARLC